MHAATAARRDRKAVHKARPACFALLALLIGAALPQRAALAADPPREARGRANSLELLLPTNAIVKRGLGQRVEVTDADEKVIGLLHAEVADYRLVIVPDGHLVVRGLSEARLTKEPFEPAARKDIIAQFKAGEFARFKTKSSGRYIYVYNTSEEFYKGTSKILESMYPGVVNYFKKQKFEVHEPASPLVVIMFRTEAEFRKYGGMTGNVFAYYNQISNQVVMYEQSKLVEVAPELAVKQAIATVAHEGAHQILHNIGIQERMSRWPLWTTEGLAEYFAPTTVDNNLRWKGAGVVNDMRLRQLKKLVDKEGRKPGELVRETVEARQLDSRGYAVAWALTHYLATKHKDKFFAYLRECSQLAPLEPTNPALVAGMQQQMFFKHFGTDYAALEEGMKAHLLTLPYIDPIENQTHYIVVLTVPGRRTVGLTSSPADVEQWKKEALRNVDPSIQPLASFEVIPFANRKLAEQYMNGR